MSDNSELRDTFLSLLVQMVKNKKSKHIPVISVTYPSIYYDFNKLIENREAITQEEYKSYIKNYKRWSRGKIIEKGVYGTVIKKLDLKENNEVFDSLMDSYIQSVLSSLNNINNNERLVDALIYLKKTTPFLFMLMNDKINTEKYELLYEKVKNMVVFGDADRVKLFQYISNS